MPFHSLRSAALLVVVALLTAGAQAQQLSPEQAEEQGVSLSGAAPAEARSSSGLSLRGLGDVLLIPHSGNQTLMVFDASTGDLIDPAYIVFTEHSNQPTQAILNFDGDGIFVSVQAGTTGNAVYHYGLDGTFRGLFAPAGGQNTSILQNVRGIRLDPTRTRLWVTVAGGPNWGAIAEFDTEGNYLGNFVEPMGSPMASPWSILIRESDVLISDSGDDGIHRFLPDGTYVGMWNQAPVHFPQQLAAPDGGNVLNAAFNSVGAVHEFESDGTHVGTYEPISNLRGIYELPTGNLLVTNSAGVHEITRENELVRTIVTGQSRHITLVRTSNLSFIPSTLHGEVPEDMTAPGSFTMRNNTEDALAFEFIELPAFISEISPAAGALPAGTSIEVSVTFDGAAVSPRSHEGVIVVQTDEAEDNLYDYPVLLTVTGMPACVIEPNPVAFGEVIVGFEKSAEVSVSNHGAGPCTLESTIIDEDDFSTDFAGPVTLSAGETIFFMVTFAPSVTGAITGTLTLGTNGDDLTTDLSGTGLPAPVATFDPPIEEGIEETLDSGETASATLTIGNVGEGVLEFDFSAFRHAHVPALDDALDLDDFTLVGSSPPENQHAATAPGGAQTNGQVVGFTFEGTVSGVGDTGTWASDMSLTITSPDGQSFQVGGFGTGFPPWDFQGHGSTNDGTYMSTHIGIFDDAQDAGQWELSFEKHFGATTQMTWTDVTITLHKGQNPFVTGVDPASGSVASGQTVDVTVAISAEGLNEGTYQAYLDLVTNEPDNMRGWLDGRELEQLPAERRAMLNQQPVRSSTHILYPVTLHVVGEAACAIEPDPIAFGMVVIGFDATLEAAVTNAGSGSCVLTGVTIDEDDFSTNLAGQVTVAPGETATFSVTFAPTSVGEITGTLTIVTDGDDLAAGLSGAGRAPPAASVEPQSVTLSVDMDAPIATETIVLSNLGVEGAVDLAYGISLVAARAKRPAGDRVLAATRGDDRAGGAAGPLERQGGRVEGGPFPQVTFGRGEGENLIQDGSFEAGTPNPFWDEASSNFGTPLCTASSCGTGGHPTGAHTGSWWAWFGGALASESGHIAQVVEIPYGSAQLSFYLAIPAAGQPGWMHVMIDDDILFVVTQEDAPAYPDYQQVVIDVSQYADGGLHELRFAGQTQAAGAVTNFFVDDVSLTSTGPAFLSVEPMSGTVAAGEAADVVLTAMWDEGIADGTYDLELLIHTNDPANALLVVEVEVVIGDGGGPPQAQVAPQSLEFELDASTNPSSWELLTLSNLAAAGASDLQFEFIVHSAGFAGGRTAAPGMLTIDPSSGAVEPGQSMEIMVTATCDDDDELGIHSFELLVHTNDPDNPELIVQVDVMVTGAVGTDGDGPPFVFALEPNRPNPFSRQTTIAYSLAEASAVRIDVYDMAGRRVATVVDVEQEAGEHAAVWDAGDLASGVYFYRIQAGPFTQTLRAVVVR